jgi:transcription initiation factor IIE alpha subunit
MLKNTHNSIVTFECPQCNTRVPGNDEDTLIAKSFDPLEDTKTNNSDMAILKLAPYDRVNLNVKAKCKNCTCLYLAMVSTETEGSWFVCSECSKVYKGNEIELSI